MGKEEKEVKKRKKTRVEKIQEQIKNQEPAILEEYDDLGLDIVLADDVSTEKVVYPKITIRRKESIGLDIEAKKLASTEFEVEMTEVDPNMIKCAKMSLMCMFDGKMKTTLEIAEFDTNFLLHIDFAYARMLKN